MNLISHDKTDPETLSDTSPEFQLGRQEHSNDEI